MKFSQFQVLLLLTISFLSCRKEVARIDLLKIPYATIDIPLDKGEQIKFWAAIDIEYEEEPEFNYNIEFYKGEELAQQSLLFAPLASKVKKEEQKNINNGITHHQFFGELDWHFIAKSEGVFTLKSSIVKNTAKGFRIHKAEVVFMKKEYPW